MPLTLTIAGLSKTYANGVRALSDVSLTIPTGMFGLLGPKPLRVALGVSFLAMTAWTLVPDRLDEKRTKLPHASVFVTTIVGFFLAEMGDKTQIATVALTARYGAFAQVVAGTTLGMMIANVPAVLAGGRLAHRLPVRFVHAVAAVIFAILGIAALASLYAA